MRTVLRASIALAALAGAGCGGERAVGKSAPERSAERPEPRLREGVGHAAPTPADAGVEHLWVLYGPFASGKCKVVENPTCPPELDTCIIHAPEVECPAGSSGHTGRITQERGAATCTLHVEEHGDTSCPAGHRCSPPQVWERALTVPCPKPVAGD